MAETRVPGRDGTTTVFNDSYAPFGEIQVGPAIRPEDPSKWQQRRFEESDVLTRFRWSAEQLETAVSFLGFPQAEIRQQASRLSWNVKRVRVWREGDVEQWAQRVRSLGIK